MRAADYLGPTGPLAQAIDGYEYRPSQLTMAEAVQQVLERDGVLLVEAGTGTGKTLAYLLPALLAGMKVVVSTGTRNLQDQIMEHDLPLLERHLGFPVDAASMKGLGNYLCLRRFEELRQSAAAVEGPLARQLPVLEQWRAETTTGDQAELDELPEDASIWAHATSSSETRIGPRCPYYEECFVTHARRRAEEAQLLVVNHHLLFADLAMRGPHGGGVLPDYDAVIFDEAHQIEDVATQFFGVQVSSSRVERLARDAGRALTAAGEPEGAPLLRNVAQTSQAFFAELPRPDSPEAGRAPLSREMLQGELHQRLLALDSALEALEAHCRLRSDRSEGIAQLPRRAQQIRNDLHTIAESDDGRRIAWTQTRGRSAQVGSSPIDVSGILREELFYRTRAVVLTSATLSTGGHFDFIKRRLGIDFEVDEHILESPFDYASQAALYTARDMPDPRSAEYVDAAVRSTLELVRITGGGAFVLCTSLRMMRELADRCASHIDGPVWVQGEAPKGTLLQRFREAGDAVLFATASFWQGVDVPGDALRLVIIDKLPFDVPSDPLVAARCERLKEEGQQPFMKYLVPSAALTLKQGFGRLVRTARDRGIVAILDSRIVRKGYGKVFLRSLPEASRCETLPDVRDFWEQTCGPGRADGTSAELETAAPAGGS
jgi:ATP-dependent DNA helicase DinG